MSTNMCKIFVTMYLFIYLFIDVFIYLFMYLLIYLCIIVYIYYIIYVKKPRHLASDLPLSFPSFLGVLDLATLPSTDLDGKNTGKTNWSNLWGFFVRWYIFVYNIFIRVWSIIHTGFYVLQRIYTYIYISPDLDREVQCVLSGRVLRLWKECQTYFGFNQVTYLHSSTEALCFGLTISTGPRHTLEVPTLAALRSRFHGAWGGVLESICIYI